MKLLDLNRFYSVEAVVNYLNNSPVQGFEDHTPELIAANYAWDGASESGYFDDDSLESYIDFLSENGAEFDKDAALKIAINHRKFTKAADEYGTVEFEGKEYAITQDAYPTSSLLPTPHNYHDVDEGEDYQFEMGANAIDEDGETYFVSWLFWDTKGNEQEDYGNYCYDTPDSVTPQ